MSELRFDGRVAVITGAGRGLGRAHAHLLAVRGAQVVVNDLDGPVGESAQGGAASVVAEILAAGGSAVADANDVATVEGGRGVVNTALEHFGRLDIVINNAGILRDGALHKMSVEKFDSVLDVHLRGAFHVTQPAFCHMREQGYGRIVNTTSGSGLYGNFGQVNYSAAKMGLVGMTKSIAIEGAKYNIMANAIAPVALSRMTEDLMTEEMRKLVPELVAPVAAYLCHEECTISGEIFTAYGGHVGRVFVGETRGVTKADLTVEDVADDIEQIFDEDGYVKPLSAPEALRL